MRAQCICSVQQTPPMLVGLLSCSNSSQSTTTRTQRQLTCHIITSKQISACVGCVQLATRPTHTPVASNQCCRQLTLKLLTWSVHCVRVCMSLEAPSQLRHSRLLVHWDNTAVRTKQQLAGPLAARSECKRSPITASCTRLPWDHTVCCKTQCLKQASALCPCCSASSTTRRAWALSSTMHTGVRPGGITACKHIVWLICGRHGGANAASFWPAQGMRCSTQQQRCKLPQDLSAIVYKAQQWSLLQSCSCLALCVSRT